MTDSECRLLGMMKGGRGAAQGKKLRMDGSGRSGLCKAAYTGTEELREIRGDSVGIRVREGVAALVQRVQAFGKIDFEVHLEQEK